MTENKELKLLSTRFLGLSLYSGSNEHHPPDNQASWFFFFNFYVHIHIHQENISSVKKTSVIEQPLQKEKYLKVKEKDVFC